MFNKVVTFLFVIISFDAFADTLFSSSVVDGCSIDNLGFTNPVSIRAKFQPINITCSSGQFLPMDSVACVNCPVETTCNGGTYAFNETVSQGIVLNNNFTQNKPLGCIPNLLGVANNVSIKAVFEPKSITCNPGYYLGADTETCTECPQNSKCTGGTYTFNETTNQGIEPCPSNIPHAPTGSAVCYPHILHIGENNIYLKSTKLTTPSLNIAIEGSVFYANLTTTPTYMNKASEQSLKIMVNGVEYYVCDDTSCPQ